RVGGGLRPLRLRQREQELRERIAAVDDRSGLGEEHVRQLLGEHGRPAAGRLDEGVAVAVGDPGRGRREQRRERTEDEIEAGAVGARRDEAPAVAATAVAAAATASRSRTPLEMRWLT